MHETRCSRITAELTRHLAEGAPLAPQLLDHVRGCSSCRTVLERAEALRDLLESSPVIPMSETEVSETAAIATATATVELSYRQRRILKLVAAGVLFVVAGTLWHGTGTVRHPYIVTAVLLVLYAGPFALAFMYTRSVPSGGRRQIYKRLVHQEVSGVCRGLSEAFGIPVWILRMMFVALAFAKGLGVWLYLALAILLPIHPEDRVHLLRFRLARWFRSKRPGTQFP